MAAQDVAFTGQLVVGLFDGHLADARSLGQFTDRVEAHAGYHPVLFDFPAIIFIDLYVIGFADRFIELQHRDLRRLLSLNYRYDGNISAILYCTEKTWPWLVASGSWLVVRG